MSTLPHALLRPGFIGLAAGFALSVSAADPVAVYFLHQQQTVRESGTANVYLEMSTYPLTEVVVPFRFVDAESTATRQVLGSDGALTEGDYYLAEDDNPDDGNGFLFDPATGEGSFTWIGYPARRFFPEAITLSGDDVIEGNETIVLEINAAGLVGATTEDPLKRHTILIQDDDDPNSDPHYAAHAFFDQSSIYALESGSASLTAKILSPSTQSRRLHWEILFGSGEGAATSADIFYDVDDDTPYSVDIGIGATQATISIKMAADLLVEGDETFKVKLTTMEYLDADGNPTGTGGFVVDQTPVEVTIRDDDPTTVQMDFSGYLEKYWDGVPILEGDVSQFAINITLSHPLEYPVEVPLILGGTAVRGTATVLDDTDWRPSPDPANVDDASMNDVITIAAGSTLYTLNLLINNDIVIEEDGKTVLISLGTPQMVGETTDTSGNTVEVRTDLPLGTSEDADGYRTSYTVTINDNDPVDIGFGKSNPALLLEDPADDEPDFINDEEIIVAESAGGVTVPIFASSTPAVSGNFEIEVMSDGTTATMLDFDTPAEDQEWDFYVLVGTSRGNVPIRNLNEATEGLFAAGNQATGISIVFNDEDEPALPYRHFASWANGNTIPDEGDEAFSTIEQEETIRLRLVQITDFDTSGLLLREPDGIDPREITVRVREVPDIDVTEQFTGLSPLEGNFVDGNPPRNAKTRLHELQFLLEPSATLKADFLLRRGTAAAEYADGDGSLDGYTAYQLAFRPSVYNVDDPEDPTNDPLRPRVISSGQISNWEPDGFTSYFRLAEPVFSPRFADSFELIELQAGVERDPKRPAFNEENAPIMAAQPYILQPLNFGRLDPVPGILREGFAELDASMDFLIEFSNGGKRTFGAEERARRLTDTRILLTRTNDSTSSGVAFNGSITGFEETADGAIMLELYNASGSSLRIQYMDAEGADAGIWKTAQPGLINGTGTNFFWIDHGPPKTDVHPSDVNFRLYRISN